jgi:hypothetical protein
LLEENLGETTNNLSSSTVLDPATSATITQTTPGSGVMLSVNNTPAVDLAATEATDKNKRFETASNLAPVSHPLSANENGLPLEGNPGKYSLLLSLVALLTISDGLQRFSPTLIKIHLQF